MMSLHHSFHPFRIKYLFGIWSMKDSSAQQLVDQNLGINRDFRIELKLFVRENCCTFLLLVTSDIRHTSMEHLLFAGGGIYIKKTHELFT